MSGSDTPSRRWLVKCDLPLHHGVQLASTRWDGIGCAVFREGDQDRHQPDAVYRRQAEARSVLMVPEADGWSVGCVRCSMNRVNFSGGIVCRVRFRHLACIFVLPLGTACMLLRFACPKPKVLSVADVAGVGHEGQGEFGRHSEMDLTRNAPRLPSFSRGLIRCPSLCSHTTITNFTMNRQTNSKTASIKQYGTFTSATFYRSISSLRLTTHLPLKLLRKRVIYIPFLASNLIERFPVIRR